MSVNNELIDNLIYFDGKMQCLKNKNNCFFFANFKFDFFLFFLISVNKVRDRINQLRNRYNLEKRKVDIQKTEGYSNAKSSWPLFDNLRFLDGHIRPRKSYKYLNGMRRPAGRPRRIRNYLGYEDADETGQTSQQYANPLSVRSPTFQIKSENTSNDEENNTNDMNGEDFRESYET